MTRRKLPTSALTKGARLIQRFAARAEDYAFVGSYHPDEVPACTRSYNRAYRELFDYVEELEQRKPTAPTP